MVLYWPRIRLERDPDAKEASFMEPSRDSKLEALVPVVEGKQPILIVANRARQIRAAAAFAAKHKLRMILGSGIESHKVAGLLREKDIPVILGQTEELPLREDDPYDERYTLPSKLHEAGVKFAFGTFDSANSRTLPYQAATAVAFGLAYEVGLKSVTLESRGDPGVG